MMEPQTPPRPGVGVQEGAVAPMVDRPRVAVVNDYPEFCELVDAVLSDVGYDVFTFVSSRSSIEDLVAVRPHLLMLDLSMGEHGDRRWEVTKVRAVEVFRRVPIVLCSADLPALQDRAERLDREEPTVLLEKPFELDELVEAVSRALTTDGDLPAR